MEKEAPEIPGVPRTEEQDPSTLDLPGPPNYTCYRIDQNITVDGRLDEDCWQKAPWLGPFVDMEKGTPVQYETRVAFLRGGNDSPVG
jgi:hypothetical protein